MQSRREFLKTAAVGMSALLVPPALFRARPVHAAGPDPVLVLLFLRGGADGLSLVPPTGDAQYYALRPNLAVPASSAIDLDGFFGLHPGLSPLVPHFDSGRMALIHACGCTDPTRSHFDAQDYVETGAPGDKTVQTGWLNRYAAAAGLASPIASITLGPRLVKSLEGGAPATAIPALANFTVGYSGAPSRRTALERIYRDGGGSLARMAEGAFSVLDTVASVDRTTSVTYPTGALAAALRDVAALVKAQVGLRVATLDFGGWDHHVSQTSEFPASAQGLAGPLAAFAKDLGSHLDRTLVLVVTEFGRRAKENGGLGTDHGHGGVALALGGGISGGRVLLRNRAWPGLQPSQLDQGDLKVTTDLRDVFSEVLHRHLGFTNPGAIFPNFSSSTSRYPGLYA